MFGQNCNINQYMYARIDHILLHLMGLKKKKKKKKKKKSVTTLKLIYMYIHLMYPSQILPIHTNLSRGTQKYTTTGSKSCSRELDAD